jgi:AraC family transcriptional regulator
MSEFSGFINQVPTGIMQKTETHFCRSTALFKPRVYMGGVKFSISDYHIVMPSEMTPDALINNVTVHGDKGKIMVVNPGDTVSCFVDAPAKPYYSFLVKADLLKKVAEEMEYTGSIRFKNLINPFSFSLLQACRSLDAESSRPDHLNLIMESLELQIASILLRELETTEKKPSPSFPESDSYIRLAEEYIKTYFSSNISLDDICQEIHVSQYHFIRMFKHKVGLTPHQYLINTRVEKAKKLLDTGEYSITEVAIVCGFTNIQHFSSTFRKATGSSPTEYKYRN